MIKICKLCGKEFEAINNNQKICKSTHYVPCPNCGKPSLWKGYVSSCSKECSDALRKATYLKKYGVESPMQVPEIRAKIKATMQERYGVDYARQNPEIKAKQLETFNKNWGKQANPEGHQDRMARMRATNIKKYGAPSYLESDEGHAMIKKLRSPKYDEVSGEGVYAALKSYVDHSTDFSPIALKTVLDALDISYQCDVAVGDYIYDIQVRDTLVCIDDTLTHNEYATPSRGYHKLLTQNGVDAGYRVIHIFDWDDPVLVAMMLQNKQSIYARDCEIAEIDGMTCDTFLRMYHTQGTTTSQKIRYGLYYNNDLVEVMTFGKSRYNNKYEYELIRMCTAPEYRVVGGASKLFKRFVEDYSPESVASYCDRSKFDGKVYAELGFEFTHLTSPSIIWSRGAEKMFDRVLNTAGYDNLFGTSFGKGKNNAQLMQDAGWLPVRDCGQAAYLYQSGNEERKE